VTAPLAVAARRAVEALRAGVPSREVVARLGSGQPRIEHRLLDLLASGAGGMLIGGGFGAGKTHLLEHLAQLALDDGYVVSRVMVSKETPLHDRAKVFCAAAESAVIPGRYGSAIAEAARALDPGGPAYAELLRWTRSPAAALNERFPASVALYARMRDSDPDFAESIVRFWSGAPIGVPDLRRRLAAAGAPRPAFGPVTAKELAAQRTRFAAKLFAAAGCAGWVILFDEVELIGRYSLVQRAKSYAEIARWVHGEHGAPQVPIAAVLAMTDDFEAALLAGRNDRGILPAKLRAVDSREATELERRAQLGMRVIEREMMLLAPLEDADLDRVYAQVKGLHAEAFGWRPPDVAGLERLGANRMRQYVRAWINEWDLLRLDHLTGPDAASGSHVTGG
jgi:BREX system ATP-binding protein BrxC/D